MGGGGKENGLLAEKITRQKEVHDKAVAQERR